MGDGGDPGGPVDVEADQLPAGERPPRPCAGPSGPGPRRRPARARRRARAGRRRPRRRADRALGKTTKNESPSVPCSSPSFASKAARRSARGARGARRSARCRPASRGCVEPSMSVNRNVDGPGRRRRGSVIARATVRRRSVVGRLRSGRAVGAASPRRMASATTGSSSMTASKSQVASARQVVGPSATTCATRGRPSRTDSSPKKSPGPSSGDRPPSRMTRAPPRHDDEEPGPDLALAGDDVVGRELDLDRDARRSAPSRPHRPRRTAGPPPAGRALRSWVRVMRPPCGCAGHAAPRERRAVNRAVGPRRDGRAASWHHAT